MSLIQIHSDLLFVDRVSDVKAQLIKLNTKIKDSEVVKIKINEVIKQLDKVKPH
jgi:hypothetical protein